MGMSTGGGVGPRSEINVTPLVDVVLVLLIIFMVVQPLLQMGYEVQVPPNAPPSAPTPQQQDQIIVSYTGAKEVYLNKEKVELSQLPIRLSELLRSRPSKIVFFSAEDSVNYGDAMKVMDVVRNAGTIDKKVNIGIVMDWVNPTAPATP